jgi:hypothetical protein
MLLSMVSSSKAGMVRHVRMAGGGAWQVPDSGGA